jgi:hypothetical protein
VCNRRRIGELLLAACYLLLGAALVEFDTFRQNSTVFGFVSRDCFNINHFIITTYVVLRRPAALGFVEFVMCIFIIRYRDGICG